MIHGGPHFTGTHPDRHTDGCQATSVLLLNLLELNSAYLVYVSTNFFISSQVQKGWVSGPGLEAN